MGQSEEIEQKWKGLKNFDICFSVMFSCFDQSLISSEKTGQKALPPINIDISLVFLSFLR